MESVAKKWRETVIPIVLLIIMVANPANCESGKQCSFPAIFNFGDSNSDTGGLSAAFGQAPPPNGITFFHSPAGRASDGRLVIDFIGIYFFFISDEMTNKHYTYTIS